MVKLGQVRLLTKVRVMSPGRSCWKEIRFTISTVLKLNCTHDDSPWFGQGKEQSWGQGEEESRG